MINFERVTKFKLEDFTINIPKNEIVGLIGATGSGKTTFIKLASGLLIPDSGRVRVLGKDPVKYRRKCASEVGVFIAGKPHLEAEDTVLQAFELIRAEYGIEKSVFKNRFSKLSDLFEFSGYVGTKVRELSLGQKMRVELAAVLIFEPKLLLLDEPNIGLDENGKHILNKVLKECVAKGMTVLVTSHDMASISSLCSRLAIIDKGKMVFYGSEANLRSKFMPINRMTVKFDGPIPNIDDLPITMFTLNKDTLIYEYNTNYVSSSEVLEVLINQTRVFDIKIQKPDLESIMIQIISGGKV